jgi:hypothetical protein
MKFESEASAVHLAASEGTSIRESIRAQEKSSERAKSREHTDGKEGTPLDADSGATNGCLYKYFTFSVKTKSKQYKLGINRPDQGRSVVEWSRGSESSAKGVEIGRKWTWARFGRACSEKPFGMMRKSLARG